jgi:hypothetical protein
MINRLSNNGGGGCIGFRGISLKFNALIGGLLMWGRPLTNHNTLSPNNNIVGLKVSKCEEFEIW